MSRRGRYAQLPGDAWRAGPLSRLSLEAAGLVSRAWSYSADQATDGVLPAHVLPGLAHGPVPKRIIAELLDSGVWERVEGGGYRCTLYLDANISREEWEAKKAGGRGRTKKCRDKKRGDVTRDGDRPVTDPVTDPVTRYPGAEENGDRAPVTPPVTRYPQTPGHQDTRTPRSAGSASEARAPATPGSLRVPDPEGDPLRAALLDGFEARWAAAIGGPWARSAVREDHVDRVLDAVRDRAGPEGELERGLATYFEHCATVGKRPEFGFELSRDFGRWCSTSSLPAGGAPKAARVARLKRLATVPIVPLPEPPE